MWVQCQSVSRQGSARRSCEFPWQLQVSHGQKESKEWHKLESSAVHGPGTHFAKTVLDEDITAPTAASEKAEGMLTSLIWASLSGLQR